MKHPHYETPRQRQVRDAIEETIAFVRHANNRRAKLSRARIIETPVPEHV